MLLWLSQVSPSWVLSLVTQDAFSQSEVRVIVTSPGPRDMWCVTHGRGVTWQGGVTPCDTVLTGATYQLLLQSDWLTADKYHLLLTDKKRRSTGSQVRCEERSEWRVNILNNLTLISLNQSLLHLELKEFWRFANKKLIWCLPWPIRDHSRVIILVPGLIWIRANLDGVEEQGRKPWRRPSPSLLIDLKPDLSTFYLFSASSLCLEMTAAGAMIHWLIWVKLSASQPWLSEDAQHLLAGFTDFSHSCVQTFLAGRLRE